MTWLASPTLDKRLQITYNGEELFDLDTDNYDPQFEITLHEDRDYETCRHTGKHTLQKINWRIEINDM